MKKLILFIVCAMAIGCAPESSDKPALPTAKESQERFEDDRYNGCIKRVLKDMEDVRNLYNLRHEPIRFNNYVEFCQQHNQILEYGYQCQLIQRVEERRGQRWN